jgi:hypoxanthine-guanine phosphoribosyltransferase
MGVQVNTQEHATRSLLWSREAIAARVNQLAIQLSRDYAGNALLLVGVLQGACVLLAALMRALEMPVHVEGVLGGTAFIGRHMDKQAAEMRRDLEGAKVERRLKQRLSGLSPEDVPSRSRDRVRSLIKRF